MRVSIRTGYGFSSSMGLKYFLLWKNIITPKRSMAVPKAPEKALQNYIYDNRHYSQSFSTTKALAERASKTRPMQSRVVEAAQILSSYFVLYPVVCFGFIH